MIFFFIRHGDPIYQPDSLTPLGQRQAEAVGRRLASGGLDRIYVSSSMRAKQTCAPTAEMCKREPVELDWCNEKYAWQQLTTVLPTGERKWLFQIPEAVRVFRSSEMLALGRGWREHPVFRGTTVPEGMDRVDRESDAFFASLGYRHDRDEGCYFREGEAPERVALFAHQGFGLAFLSSLLDLAYPVFCTTFDIQHSGMSVIHFPEPDDEGRVYPQCLQLSNDGHLWREGLPVRYNNILPL